MSGRAPKILVMHASVGAGHRRAALAVASALSLEEPGARVEVVDALELASPWFSRAYAQGYLQLVRRAPRLFGLIFDWTDRAPEGAAASERLRVELQRRGTRELSRFLERGRWDAVVHTHFLAPELTAASARSGRFEAAELVVVTDYDAHRLWARNPYARYCAAGRAAASLRRLGVPSAAVAETGIPIDPGFCERPSKEAARREWGLDGARPVAVLAGGGHGVGPLESVYRALLSVPTPIELVAVCGRSESSRLRLARVPVPARHRARAIGYTERMRELLSAADLLVTKPGGLTVSEALACGLPMILTGAIPGQEERNADFLTRRQAAVAAPHAAAAAAHAARLLAAPQELAAMSGFARALGRPGAAFEVARRALALARVAVAA